MRTSAATFGTIRSVRTSGAAAVTRAIAPWLLGVGVASTATFAAPTSPASATATATSTAAATAISAPARPVAIAPPAEIGEALAGARPVGEGLYRHFGFRIYLARLWAGDGFDAARFDQMPFALELRYERDFDGVDIAERSLQEMRRAGALAATESARWRHALRAAFPDVVKGDRLVGLHDGRGGVRFFHNGRPTGAIDDTGFARRFFGIWLMPSTSAPDLRAALIGPERRERP